MAKSDLPGQKPGYYAILPAVVRYDDRLRPNGKLLYAEITAMGTALIAASKQDDWRRGVGIPHAATWLNQRRWERAPETGTAGAEDERAQTEVARW